MSWHNGTWAATTAGLGISTIWDGLVVANAHWSVHDAAAGTNEKVYKCEDVAENILFYVRVKDNQAGYWEVELWEGWDAGAHAGVGVGIAVSSSTYSFRARRPVGPWYLSVLDHRIIYIDGKNWQGQYIGAPRRYDRSRNIVLIMSPSTGTSYYNCLTYWTGASTVAASRFLFDEQHGPSLVQGDGGAGHSSYRQIMGVDGNLRFAGEFPVSGKNSGLAVGTLEGVADLGAGTSLNFSPAAGETVTIDGVDWLIFSGTYETKVWCAVRKA